MKVRSGSTQCWWFLGHGAHFIYKVCAMSATSHIEQGISSNSQAFRLKRSLKKVESQKTVIVSWFFSTIHVKQVTVRWTTYVNFEGMIFSTIYVKQLWDELYMSIPDETVAACSVHQCSEMGDRYQTIMHQYIWSICLPHTSTYDELWFAADCLTRRVSKCWKHGLSIFSSDRSCRTGEHWTLKLSRLALYISTELSLLFNWNSHTVEELQN